MHMCSHALILSSLFTSQKQTTMMTCSVAHTGLSSVVRFYDTRHADGVRKNCITSKITGEHNTMSQ